LRVSNVEELPVVDRLRVAEHGGDEPLAIPLDRPLLLDVESPEGESRFESDGEVSGMPIVGIRVATRRDEFHRVVRISRSDDGRTWRPVGGGQVFRLRGGSEEDTVRESLEITVRRTAAPYWQVTLLNRGDPPIDDLEVTLLRLDQRLAYRAPATGSLRLIYGNGRATATAYELEKLVTREQTSAARTASLLGVDENLAYESPEPFSERHPAILWSALVLAVVVLSGLALAALR
jgi:hypothetical protein